MSGGWRGGNRIDLLESGAQYFPALIEAIESARHEVFLETYIYADDATARRVTEALAAAAGRGVAVRILIDGFGARDFAPGLRSRLLQSGAQVLVYRQPLWWQPVRGLRRMHRKIAVADGRIGFVGGINIIDDWNTPNEVPPRLDYAVRVEGPLVGDIAGAAWHLWTVVCYAALRARGQRPAFPRPPPTGSVRARLLVRDNLGHRRDIEDAYLAAFATARHSIVLAIAYFLPSARVREALAAAAARGVAVTILLQGPSDHLLLKRAAEFLYRRLAKAGIRIVEYHASFLHSKVGLVDDTWATVGSSNLDPFSLLLSREANVEIVDRGFNAGLRARLDAAVARGGRIITADAIAHVGWPRRLAQWASYRFARAVIDLINLAESK